ncbi:threonine synthase [Lacticaseibacillus zeae]|uniref:Threonine synthase n=1 Tax=Lacticaseibacillus zeae TaxID=57037 RepID=A0A5R8LT84_LACZE|nr:threonine synthase [Lacticaseibacillus zeae]TLF40444.1 threonine synthase [Lacticaseibacillus zeae]
MRYTSTRDQRITKTSQQAIKQGISEEGGLFVLPHLMDYRIALQDLLGADYETIAQHVLMTLLPDFNTASLKKAIHLAYRQNFSDERITPIRNVGDFHVLELFHGPTSAFKDVGLQLLPQLMRLALDPEDRIMILAATSGDTGTAALQGFKNVPQTGISVFYPDHGVSPIQEQQMLTTTGRNTRVFPIAGNFDQAQSAVKALFTDTGFAARLQAEQVTLSAANSINIGRLIPQVVYYFAAYLQLVNSHAIQLGEPVNFTVPTGNFGDVLAGFYAKALGLPIHKLIAAANANREIADFLDTGIYDRNRPFLKTVAPSMDIQISSNLERLLYYKSGEDSAYVAMLMKDLAKTGRYRVRSDVLAAIQADFAGGFATDEQVAEAIATVWQQDGYLMDPHTAVGYSVMQQYRDTGDTTPNVLLATASPYKFPRAVTKALDLPISGDDFSLMTQLQQVSGVAIPANLARLATMTPQPKHVVAPAAMGAAILNAAKEVFDDDSRVRSGNNG